MATANSNANAWTPEQQAKYEDLQARMDAVDKELDAAIAALKDKPFVQYTMFVSGLRRGRLADFESKNQSDDLAILFDSVIRHTYTKDYTKTSYAVESKAKASDHVVTQDGKFSFSAVITDSPYLIDQRNYIDRDTDKDNPMGARRPAKTIALLEDIANAHRPITLVTEDNILTNYVITSFKANRDADSGSSISVDVDLEEFRFKMVNKTVLAKTTNPKKAGKANSGNKQTADGGAADDNAKAKRQTPYIGKNAASKEQVEYKWAGTTDFSGKPGKQLEFDPNNLLRK